MKRISEKLDWNALKATVGSLDWGVTLPESVNWEDETMIKNMHLLLVKR